MIVNEVAFIIVSLYFSSIVKSRSNPFLEPTSTKQWGKRFLVKETSGAFDGVRQDWSIISQTRYPLHHTARSVLSRSIMSIYLVWFIGTRLMHVYYCVKTLNLPEESISTGVIYINSDYTL